MYVFEQFDILDFNALPREVRMILGAIAKELVRAEEKHPTWPVSRDSDPEPNGFSAAAAILMEEAGEVVRSCVKVDRENGREEEIAHEAIQTAAVCVRLIKNLDPKQVLI
jgi:NTP pyrophosphatase (non-canonical NTP hydrolase)